MTRYSSSPISFLVPASSERDTRGSRRMLRILRCSGRWPLTTSSFSSPTQTIETWGRPSGSRVTRCASAADSSTVRAEAGSSAIGRDPTPATVWPVTTLGRTELDVFPLCLGGNVFGWTADHETSFAVLDAYVAAGGNFIDTADLYARQESERIIGEWMQARSNRDGIVLATKLGMLSGREGLSAANIATACEDSLQRLQTTHIDLYYAHRDR